MPAIVLALIVVPATHVLPEQGTSHGEEAAELSQLVGLLGMTPRQAFARLGPPAEVFALRGEEPWHDDVVFYYPHHVYLFWFQNRVWQVRVDHRYAGAALGLRMGDTKARVRRRLGPPLAELQDGEIHQLTDVGYPIRLRLVFEGGRLSDAYLYRGDF